MNTIPLSLAEQIAEVASAYQGRTTGHAPTSVTVNLSDDTLVVTLHEALTPAEQALVQTAEGAAQVQDFHRRLFASSDELLRKEIERITGRRVREAGAEIETPAGNVVHAFKTGAMVQVFLLRPLDPPVAHTAKDVTEVVARAEDDGLRVVPNVGPQKGSAMV